MAQFVHNGQMIDYVAPSAVAAGQVVVQGELVGVARLDIASGATGALAVEGTYDFPKATGAATAITAGANVYWDAAEGVAKTDSESGANKLIGKTTRAAADADTTVRVRLNQ